MFDALLTALGKPESPLRIILIGTLAPFGVPGHWWYDLVTTGSRGSTYVQALQGERKTWDKWATIRKANPLTSISAPFRAKLLQERDDARADSRLLARFLSYRLNVPTPDDAAVLLTTDDWKLACARPVPPREGQPVVGVDLGAGRAWSAATPLWPNGRCEAVALSPGLPDLDQQEKRDRVPAGTYRHLVDSGLLTLSPGKRVPDPAELIERIMPLDPLAIICDRFRISELLDAVKGRCRVIPRVSVGTASRRLISARYGRGR